MISKEEAQQVFDGVMLSDGGLGVPRKGINARFQIKLSGEEHIDWLYHIRDALWALGVSVSPGYPKLVAHQIGRQPCVMLSTLCDPFLTRQYHRWYPHNVKEVLEDFQFTPVSLANAFMGDGSSSARYPHSVMNRTVYVKLCTESYSLLGISRIEQALFRLGITEVNRIQQYRNLKNGGSGVRVYLRQCSVDSFMDIVEPYILPSYRYKIKRKRLK